MKKKTSRRKRIKKKLLNRYRMVILNEETFEEQLYFRLTRLNVIIIVTFLFALLTTGTILLVAYTPIKEFIPGYASTKMRKQAAANARRLDSLTTAYLQSEQQLNVIRKVLKGEIQFESFEQMQQKTDTQNTVVRPIPKRGKEDSLLRALIAQEDKYSFTTKPQTRIEFLFFPPAEGDISQRFDPVNNHYAVDIVLQENAPIKAIAEGVVIFSEWTADTGYVIIVKHPNGFLSTYKHNSSLSKRQGERVQGGEVIATAGDTGEYSTGYHLHFELWSDGFPMNPENFIDFSPN